MRHILEAQHKTIAAPKFTEITEKDLADFDAINRDSVFAKVDKGLTVALPRVIIGACSPVNNVYTLDVLAGDYPAKGKLTYDVKFN